MRKTNFLMVLFALISVGGFAGERPQSDSASPSSQFDLLKKPLQGMQIENFQLPSDLNRFKNSPFGTASVSQPFTQRGSPVCYVLDTYVMRRQDPHSDLTEPAGHATCSPSSQYSLKNAVGVKAPPIQ